MRQAEFLTDPQFLDVTEGAETQKLRLLGELRVYSKVLGRELTVASGFEFEESIPTVLFSLSRPRGESKRAACVQDWLYRFQGKPEGMVISRKQADEVYYELLKLKGVATWRAYFRWLGVRAGGGFAWRSNQNKI